MADDDDTALRSLREALDLDGKVASAAHPRAITSLGSICPHIIVHIQDAERDGT
jgi:hypothetical protein